MSDQPPLEEFLAEAEAFLDSLYARRAPEERSRFQWGEGSDEVRVFQEPDAVEEAEALPRIRAWRADLWDAGLGWISGPTHSGGRGLPRSYEAAFTRLTREYDVRGDEELKDSGALIAPALHNT